MEELISRSKKAYYELLRDGWIPGEDYVFISYSSRDWEKAYPCVLALRALGINVYIDIEFRAGFYRQYNPQKHHPSAENRTSHKNASH